MEDKNLHNNYPEPDIPVDQAWKEMQQLLTPPPVSSGGGSSAGGFGKLWLLAGTGLVLIALISYWQINRKKPEAAKELIVITSQNQPLPDTLPGGAIVFLDHHSSLLETVAADSPTNFRVNGGAYFNKLGLSPQLSRIQVGSMTVFPENASLFLSHDSAEGLSAVQLQEGKARMEAGGVSLQLKAGESILFNEKTRSWEQVRPANVNLFSYATRIFAFSDTPLPEAAAAIAKAYGVEIHLADDRLNACRITTRFDNKPLKEMLDVMAYTLNFQYSIDSTGRKVTFRGQGCD